MRKEYGKAWDKLEEERRAKNRGSGGGKEERMMG